MSIVCDKSHIVLYDQAGYDVSSALIALFCMAGTVL
jgi:hypothetical protein